ncbi:hypothetical protein ABKV19_014984 [Rosa sericea]
MFQTDSKQSPDGWFFQSLHVRLSSRQEMRKAVLVELEIRCKRREDSGALAFLKFKKKTTVADIWDLPRQIAMQQPQGSTETRSK